MKDQRGNRIKRGAALVAVVVASLVAFASLGGVGLAQSAAALAEYQYGKDGKKVTICHKGKRTIRVSVRAWPAHKRHGDVEGACAAGAQREHGNRHHKKHGNSDQQQQVTAPGADTDSDEATTSDSGKYEGKGHGQRNK